jgi:hypothetical protein
MCAQAVSGALFRLSTMPASPNLTLACARAVRLLLCQTHEIAQAAPPALHHLVRLNTYMPQG